VKREGVPLGRSLTVFVALALPCIIIAGGAPAASAATCPSLKMLVVTGSGEHSGLGHTLGSVVSDVYAQDTNNASAERIEYPAIEIKLPTIVEYNWSVGLGVNALTVRINSFLSECHSTPLFLLGYSQGAQVVGDVYLHRLSDAARARVTGIVLLGDPEFWGGQNAPVDVGSYDPALNGISTTIYPNAPIHVWSRADAAKVRSYCITQDPVCNYTLKNAVGCFFSCTHVQYAETFLIPFTTYTDHAAKFILSRWAGNAPPPTPPPLPPDSGGASGTLAVPAGTWAETTGGAARSWTNYASASGAQGPVLQAGQTVGVSCTVQGYAVSDGNRWWYRIASSPWGNAYYASADAFYNNGHTSGSLVGTPFVDNSVPTCADSNPPPPTAPPPLPPPPPSTYSETTGGVAHTWTDYVNAGGTQGPSIPSNATVQIACKVTGFRVADGNTWWYKIASSPWNGAYYVSADAFYNNGETSGSLIGTPFVDNNVANC
jgi:Cutinase